MTQTQGESTAAVPVLPLTRLSTERVPYTRRLEVERQIAAVLPLSPAEIIRRAHLAPQDPAYLHSETLVYLARHARRHGLTGQVDDLTGSLIQRCQPYIHKRLGALSADAREEGEQEVLAAVFEQVFALDSDAGDYLQVQFGSALKRLAIDAFRRQSAKQNATMRTVSFQQLRGFDATEGERTIGVERLEDFATPSGEEAIITRDLIRDALDTLPEPLRQTWILQHHFGYPVESLNPEETTISSLCGTTPRTIRNRLKQAENHLNEWRRKQQ